MVQMTAHYGYLYVGVILPLSFIHDKLDIEDHSYTKWFQVWAAFNDKIQSTHKHVLRVLAFISVAQEE